MSVLYIALPVALALAGIAVAAFAFSVRGGQFDDLDTPPLRMLFDDPPERTSQKPVPSLCAVSSENRQPESSNN